VVIADVELDELKKLRMHGSVRNIRERRNDMYEVRRLRPSGRLKILKEYLRDNYEI
jgi:hypothetical protein